DGIRDWSVTGVQTCAVPICQVEIDGASEVLVLHVLERDGHHLACAIDLHLAEELQPETGRKVIALFAAASFLEHRARAKSVVERSEERRVGKEGNSPCASCT